MTVGNQLNLASYGSDLGFFLARAEQTYIVKFTFVSVDEKSGVQNNAFVLVEQPFSLVAGFTLFTVGDDSTLSLPYT